MYTQFQSVGSSGAIYDNLQIAVGTDEGYRVGYKIHPVSLDIDGVLAGGQSNTGTDDSTNTVRLVVFLGNPGISAATCAAGWALSKPVRPTQVTGCHRVLHEELITLTTPGRDSTGYLPATRRYKARIPLAIGDVLFASATTSSANKGIYIFMISDSLVVPHCGFSSGSVALSYTDI